MSTGSVGNAVHFGAGNIGRGFVGLLLHQAGYRITFVDVDAALIEALNHAESYQVHEVGPGGQQHTVTGFDSLNSATDEAGLTERIAEAQLVTTAVGPQTLRFVAPALARGLAARSQQEPLVVMACENAMNATDLLKRHLRACAAENGLTEAEIEERALFANTAVDRIVPTQGPEAGLDVQVEPYCEWAIETEPLVEYRPHIPGVTWVGSLAPVIERKLFTVNTGHATTAYLGRVAGYRGIAEAFADPAVRSGVEAVLSETSELLVRKHGLDAAAHECYVQAILARFANPSLTDTVERVGRGPLRKLSRHERFIAPASELAQRGLPTAALQRAIGAALSFDAPDDPEAVRLQELLAGGEATTELVKEIMGISTDQPLHRELAALIRSRRGC